MKRSLLIILSMILIISTLSACSRNEILFSERITEILSIDMGEINGKISINQPYNIDLDISGNFDIQESSKPYMFLNVKMTTRGANNKVRRNSGIIFVNENNVYVSKKIVQAIKELTEDQKYMNLFVVKYANYDYIKYSLEKTEDVLSFIKELNENLSKENLQGFYDLFNECKLKIVNQEEANILGLELIDTDIVNLPKLVFEYLFEHKKEISTKEISGNAKNITYNLLGVMLNKNKISNIFIDNTLENLLQFEKRINQVYENYINEYEKDLEIKQKIYNGSRLIYNTQYIKKTNKYRHSVELFLNNKNKTDRISLSGFIDIIENNNIKKEILNSTNISVEQKIDIDKENNTPYRVNISWKNNDNIAIIRPVFKLYDRYPEYEMTYCLLEDRIYLPLRQIAEIFLENVQWDDVNKKAYVIRENEKIDMTGIIIDNLTYIKIRDFEKLGYKIDYQQSNSMNYASIIR